MFITLVDKTSIKFTNETLFKETRKTYINVFSFQRLWLYQIRIFNLDNTLNAFLLLQTLFDNMKLHTQTIWNKKKTFYIDKN